MNLNFTTFVFEVINFVVLLWLLKRLLYAPLREAIAARKATIARALAEAEAQQVRALAEQESYQEKARQLDALREHVFQEATERAAEERARILRLAREDASAERARVQRLLDSEREASMAWVRETAVQHSTEVAGRLLTELAPREIDDALLDRFLEEFGRTVSREPAPPGEDRLEVEVTFARTPSDRALDRFRQGMTEVLGGPPSLVIREDSSLGSGLVVRLCDRVYDASLSGQLDLFRERVRELIAPEVAVA